MRSRFTRLILLPTFIFIGSLQSTIGSSLPNKIDPHIQMDSLGKSKLERVRLSLRFSEPLKAQDLIELEEKNIIIEHALAHLYIASVPTSTLPFLKTLPTLEYAQSLSLPASTYHPLYKSISDIGARAAQIHHDGNIGQGRIIADIDSGIDVLHPHFFFADGPRTNWIDVNQNGELEEGVDGIDLNSDGQISENEHIRFAQGFDIDQNPSLISDAFQTRRDWIYIDRNRDQKRNAGAVEGFTEEDLAYGEPIFVAEDVNKNGKLDPNEVLVQLGSSKIVKLVTKTQNYERGINLIDAAMDPDENDFAHGTSVASIILGGQYGFHDRVGVAPGAQIVMYRAESEDASFAYKGLLDAIENKYDLVLHEWTESIRSPIDGSGNYEALIDLAYEQGIPSINPLGNLNASGKHIQRIVDGPETFAFLVDGENYSSFDLSVFWINEQEPVFSLVLPEGQSFPIEPNGQIQIFGDIEFVATKSTSTRGTQQFSLRVQSPMPKKLSPGEWTLRVDQLNAVVLGRVGDPQSGWAEGIRWTSPTADRGSVVFPATADQAFGVAALGRTKNGLFTREFSGRGPRLDGTPLVDLGSPDDPYSAFAATKNRIQSGLGRTQFSQFGGTSGAAAHVAGAYLLLRNGFPDLSPSQLSEKLKTNADRFSSTLPDNQSGAGSLNIFRALYDLQVPATNQRPDAVLTFRNDHLDSSTSSDPDGDAIQVRYDFEHDGIFDTEWEAPGLREYIPSKAQVVHLQVRDRWGEKHGVLLSIGPELPVSAAGGGGLCQSSHPQNAKNSALLQPIFFLLFVMIWTRRSNAKTRERRS